MAEIEKALAGLQPSARREALKHLATALLAASRRPREPRKPRNPAKFAAVSAGQRHVYVIGSPGHPVKIGVARSPEKRRRGLQTGSAHKLKVFFAALCPLGQELAVEAACHKALMSYHIEGEWFDVNAEHATLTVQKTLERFA